MCRLRSDGDRRGDAALPKSAARRLGDENEPPVANSASDPLLGPRPPSFVLTPRQESLREALAAQSPEAARLYVGGLKVVNDENNPCGLRLGSMAMRELIDELARARGVAGLRGGSVKNRINNLRQRVNGLAAVLRVPNPSAQHISRLLDHLDEFFEREAQTNPSRKEKMRLVVAAISVGADAPALVVDPQAERLATLSAEFGAILHGSRSREEFGRLLAEFESLMLDLLTPETFEDYATIDSLLEKGPPQ